MTVATATPVLSDVEHRTQLRRAVVASTVGTAIEWYDFFLYGTAAGLVFPKLFFPNSDPLVGTLNSFLIYGAGFAARAWVTSVEADASAPRSAPQQTVLSARGSRR